MNGADLSFVHLGITIEHMRNSISIFGFRVAFYGIIIGLGMLAGMWVGPGSLPGFCPLRHHFFHHRREAVLCDF